MFQEPRRRPGGRLRRSKPGPVHPGYSEFPPTPPFEELHRSIPRTVRRGPISTIGPGLKGLSKRGTFSVNGNKITDESLKAWIENRDQLMPPFKDVLEAGQIKDVIAYVKSL
jgi:hypothetical protein